MKLKKFYQLLKYSLATTVLSLTLSATPSQAYIPKQMYTDSPEAYCLAQAIYFEAKGEPIIGQLAVGHVVLNRSKDSRFPTSICGVVQQTRHGCQFSWYCDGKTDVLPNNLQANKAKLIASFLLLYKSPDITNGALFFHANYVQPRWAKRSELTIEIGNHLFYRRP